MRQQRYRRHQGETAGVGECGNQERVRRFGGHAADEIGASPAQYGRQAESGGKVIGRDQWVLG